MSRTLWYTRCPVADMVTPGRTYLLDSPVFPARAVSCIRNFLPPVSAPTVAGQRGTRPLLRECYPR